MPETNAPLPAVELATSGQPEAAVIWLHGLGADGHDFEPVVPQLGLASVPGIRFVFPHAPVRPVTINGGMPMRAWYDIRGMNIADRADQAGVHESVAITRRLIERECARGIDMGRIILAGFSQGGAVALTCALGLEQKLAGVIALSTYLPLPQYSDTQLTDAGRGQTVFMAHGNQDPVVPIALGRVSRDWLFEREIAVSWHEYAMQHAVSPQEILDIGAFMQARLQV